MVKTRLAVLALLLLGLLLYYNWKKTPEQHAHPRIHDKHLAWGVASHVHVISLERRGDRRASLSPLLDAFGLFEGNTSMPFGTYFMATDASDPRIARIEQHVRWQRQKEYQATRFNTSKAKIGSFEESWDHSLDVAWGSDYWGRTPLRDDVEHERYLPPPDILDPDSDHTILVEKGNPFNPHKHTPNTTSPSLPVPLTRAVIACWHSHATLIRDIALRASDDGGNQTFIVLEDDIDFEWDIEERLATLWKALPVDWELVMLGRPLSTR